MELWNDYEGKVLDGQYCLDRLIGPKGRSAFFTTKDSSERPATIRVIESLNDEDEILARWNSVRGIDEPHLVKILACNKTVLDGVHLVYAVLEATDGELAEILRERPLTADETRQVAMSVVAGLEALHARGLVHEHVDAESVLAQGETVKLRSDCVRERPEGAAGETLERRDAHDFAMLIGYALTQRRDAAGARLPRPFDELVKNGMSGVWGLREMGSLVRPVASLSGTKPAAAKPVTAPASGAAPGTFAAVLAGAGETAAGTVAKPVAMASAQTTRTGVAAQDTDGIAPVRRPTANGAAGTSRPAAMKETGTSPQAVAASLSGAPAEPGSRRGSGMAPGMDRIALEPEEHGRSQTLLWAGVAAAVVLLSLLIWHFTHTPAASTTTAAPVAMTPRSDTTAAANAAIPTVPTAAKPSAGMAGNGRSQGAGNAARAAQADPATAAAAPSGSGAARSGTGPEGSQWRVVAFTYNREAQAERKAQSLAQTHPELKPEVFTPNGRAPYVVALGGWMNVQQAASLRERARGAGLPRDMYAQNYRPH